MEIVEFVREYSKKTKIIKTAIDELELSYTYKGEKEKQYYNLKQVNEEKSKTKFVIFENYLVDVTKFIDHHPGRPHLIEDNLYSDVGRYMTGTQAYSQHYHTHYHSASTFKKMLNEMVFAEIKDENKIILKHGPPSDTITFNLLSSGTMNESYIQLNSKIQIAESVYEFRFVPQQSLRYAKFLPGITWIGKHFSVSSLELNKTRYYSLCLTLDENVKQKHLQLLQNVAKLDSKQEIENVAIPDNENYVKYLSLYIKRYPEKQSLSDYIHNLPLNTQSDLIIRGPLGVGLNLYDNKLTGTHIIFAAGTGVLPFIDLISFTLRYVVKKVSKERFNNINNIIDPNEPFEDIVSSTFKLHFFATFAIPQDVIFGDVCEELDRFDRRYNLGVFRYTKRISSESEKRWDSKFIEHTVAANYKNVNKVYLIGPIAFMDNIKEALLETNCVEKDNILLV